MPSLTANVNLPASWEILESASVTITLVQLLGSPFIAFSYASTLAYVLPSPTLERSYSAVVSIVVPSVLYLAQNWCAFATSLVMEALSASHLVVAIFTLSSAAFVASVVILVPSASRIWRTDPVFIVDSS